MAVDDDYDEEEEQDEEEEKDAVVSVTQYLMHLTVALFTSEIR